MGSSLDPTDRARASANGRPGQASAGWDVIWARGRFLLLRYWWIFAACGLVGLGVQGYLSFTQPLRYVSTARMMVNGHVSMPGAGGDVYSEDLMLFYGTQVALMKSGETAAEAVARVRALDPEVTVDETAAIDAEQIPKTSVFELRVTSLSPEYAQDLLDAVMDAFLASKRGRKDRTTDGAVAAITEQIAKLNDDTRRDEQQLLDFQKNNDVVFIEQQSSNAATRQVELNNEMDQYKKEYDLLTLQSASPGATLGTEATGANPASSTTANLQQASANIVAEQETIAKLKIARDGYGTYLKDKHPKMIALADAIAKEEQFLGVLQSKSTDAWETHRLNLALEIKNLQAQIALANKRSLDFNERLGEYQELSSKISREQTLYNQFASSIQNVDLSKSMGQDDIIPMGKASPAAAANPAHLRQMLIGLAEGFAAAALLVFLISRLDARINSPLDLEQSFALPLLGQLPLAEMERKTRQVPLLAENDSRHLFGESYRNLRSSILFRAAAGEKPRALLITSAVPGEGKSTLAANLAISFALGGSRTLLIDADLRRGVLHTLFGAELHSGLSDFLAARAAWQEVVQGTSLSNLDLIPRGRVPRQAGDLLLSAGIDLLLRESVAEYDLVIWDSAPLLAADDAANLCAKVDNVLFVVRIGFSTVVSVREALDELHRRGAQLLGLVANSVRPRQPGYRNRYQYKDYYQVPAESEA